MENQLDGDEVILEIPGGERKSNSNNIELVQLDQDQCLRSRKKMSSFTDSSGIEIPKSSPIPRPQQVDVVQTAEEEEEDGDDDEDDKDNDDDDNNDDEIYSKEVTKVKVTEKLCKKIKILFSINCMLIFSITIVLILSKTIDKLETIEIWIFELWEWCVLTLAILCGRFLSIWCTNALFLLIEKNFLLRQKVRYIVQSLQKSSWVFIWLGLILLTWELLINRGVRESRSTRKVVKYITTLVVAGLWILRTLLVKIINSSIYVSRYFDRIQDDIFHYYILQTLSGPSLTGGSESINGRKEEEEQKKGAVIDVPKLRKLNPNIISVGTMKLLIKVVRESDFPNPSDENAGYAIFRNVAKPGHKYITEDDLLRFMNKDEVKQVLSMIGGDKETKSITNKSFSNWVANVSENHSGLVFSIHDTKSAIKELNKFVTAITILVLIIIWLIITKIATTEVLLFISSQFLLAIFTFGASAKSTFEAIIFVFVKYPYDVGDRCVVDGVQVVVEEVNILTTVFLRYDNEKIYYPNSELATKAISNFNRSPDMSDYVDFDLDVSTSNEIISVLKAKIKGYIDRKPQFWRPKHIVRVKEIQDTNKMKMSLYVTHTINFQNYEKRNKRISKLVTELKKFFEELDIKYHFLSPRSLHDGTLAV